MNSLISIAFYIFIIAIVGGAATSYSDGPSTGFIASMGIFGILLMIWGLANICPGIALIVRRLRDAGYHWAFIFIQFIPFGSIALLVLLSMPTKQVPNDFNNFQP